MQERVVITGLGTVNPSGNNLKEFWKNIQVGKNSIKNISLFDTNDFKVKIAGECSIELDDYFNSKELNKLDRFTAFSLIAADEAIKDSNLKNNFDPNKAGVIIGSGIGGIKSLENQHIKLLDSPKKVSPYFIPSMISDISPGHISIKYGFKGPNYCVVSACASSNHAIGNAYKMIKYGEADIIVAGGAEAGITPLSIAGFMNMKALSTNCDIKKACRPFDLKRDGFAPAEGGGILVVESMKHAQERGAKIYAEIAGWGVSSDAYHLVQPHPDGIGAGKAMSRALDNAQIEPFEVNYINAHGTSTPINDRSETAAIKMVFGKLAYDIPVSSTKSMIGHSLGASGSLEAIACVKSIEDGILHPTINQEDSDPECDLDYIPNTARESKIDIAISNSFGFGGQNACLVIKKFPG